VYCVDDLGGVEYVDFYGVDVDVVDDCVYLFDDEWVGDWMDVGYVCCVLGGQCCDCGYFVYVVGCEGF